MNRSLIPIFPLQLVCYPSEVLNLHIFEPRYKQLITEAEAKDMHFGIPTFLNKNNLEYGTEVKLKEIAKKYPDGKVDIRVEGIRVFKITNLIPRINGRLYSGADVILLENEDNGAQELNLKLVELLVDFQLHLQNKKPIPKNLDFKTYDIAHYVGLSLEQEYEFLKINSELERQEYLINHLELTIPILNEIKALEEKVKMNGHFKNIIPPKI